MKSIPFPYNFLLPVSLMILLISIGWQDFIVRHQLVIGVGLILFLGIPHGATDYKIYRVTRENQGWGLLPFLGAYLGIMALYGLLWWVAPALSLLIFLLMSLYHFGESNWHRFSLSRGEKWGVYGIYGAFFLFAPILLHWAQSRILILQILGRENGLLLPDFASWIPLALYLGVLGLIFFLLASRKISARLAAFEFLSVTALFVLYNRLPLLPAFAVYFVFWHAIVSMKDQKDAIARAEPGYNWKSYLTDSLPFSLAAVISLLVLAFVVPELATQYVSLLFILIAMLTMPHMILIERLIQKIPIGRWGTTS